MCISHLRFLPMDSLEFVMPSHKCSDSTCYSEIHATTKSLQP